jgi:Cytochrome c554 and c-prime
MRGGAQAARSSPCGRRSWLLAISILSSAALALGGGCKSAATPAAPPPKTPSLRIYVVSTAAGALEPCGCVKDQLGGIDHAVSYVKSQAATAPNSLVLGAGPMLFTDPRLDATSRTQDEWKAETLAASFRMLGLVAWAPGANDWADGADQLAALRATAGAALIAANLTGKTAGARATLVTEVGGYKVGLCGVSQPGEAGALPAGVQASDPHVALAKAEAELEKQGARIRVALVALGRGAALRLADSVKGFQVMIVGKTFDQGEGNDAPTPPELVGHTLVVQSPNHLQGIAVVDLYVRGDAFEFQDASGIQLAEKKTDLEGRIVVLKQRLVEWQKAGSKVKAADVAARRRDLARLEQQLAHLGTASPPKQGSFFRYSFQPVVQKLGADPVATALMQRYYDRVNEHNRVAFANRLPPPVPAGQSGYVGDAVCGKCHKSEHKFWSTTPHAHAYATLVAVHKQYNLDCVGCHVTGYEKPGGSTVTHADKLENVQCEVCHGPGSRHAADPKNPTFIDAAPSRSLCASSCHHPPHVHADWDVSVAFTHIIGKGHGM